MFSHICITSVVDKIYLNKLRKKQHVWNLNYTLKPFLYIMVSALVMPSLQQYKHALMSSTYRHYSLGHFVKCYFTLSFKLTEDNIL
jgi:hypothetical protein